ncbi:MAG: DUF1275 family protein [Phycisphaerae bacterium]|nr:DUF1275 family protein [Phycisphaerae bacterium]
MLLAPAHSFSQQARLAITLAWVAGYTNVLTLLACGHVTSHVSGTTADLGVSFAERRWGVALFLVYLLVTFFCGAVISGISTEVGHRRAWESIYVLPIAIEAALLAALAIGIETAASVPMDAASGRVLLLTGIASAAMGLQNATITRISSGVVRTTHVTGVLTDLGLESVQFAEWLFDSRRNVPPGSARAVLRSARVHPTARRLVLLGSILGSFAVGAGLGAVAFHWVPQGSMFPPVFFLLWLIYADVRQPIAEIESSDLVLSTSGLGLPEALAVFHVKRENGRAGAVHRMPNLVRWVEQLPSTTKVIIFDLAEMPLIPDNAAGELRAALARLRERGQHLLISGINGEGYEQLRKAGAGDVLHPENVCSDLELSIARGVNLLEDLAAIRASHVR